MNPSLQRYHLVDHIKSTNVRVPSQDLKQTELEMMLQIYQKKLDFSKRLLDEYHLKEKPFLDNISKIFNGDQIVRILTGHCLKRRGVSTLGSKRALHCSIIEEPTSRSAKIHSNSRPFGSQSSFTIFSYPQGSSWDDATLKKAAKLYFLCSPQGYQEILSLKLPLPSSHTLQK